MANYYNYNNVKFLVNNQTILADSISFSANSKLTQDLRIDQAGDFGFVPEGGLESSMSIRYFLTGIDPLRRLTESAAPAVFDLAGMALQEGYLQSYSLNAAPFGPAQVDVSVVFYEDLGGSFVPTVLPDEDYDYLRFSDMTMTFAGIDATSKVRSLNYAFTCDMQPLYNMNSLTPVEMRYMAKTTALSMDTYNFQEALPYEGKDVDVEFTLGPESFQTRGKLDSKSIQVEFGQKLYSNLSIESSSHGEAPTLSNNQTTTIGVGDRLYIWGTNLNDATTVYFTNNIKAQKIERDAVNQSSGEVGISVIVPRFARPGPLKIITPYGEASYNITTINNQTFVP